MSVSNDYWKFRRYFEAKGFRCNPCLDKYVDVYDEHGEWVSAFHSGTDCNEWGHILENLESYFELRELRNKLS